MPRGSCWTSTQCSPTFFSRGSVRTTTSRAFGAASISDAGKLDSKNQTELRGGLGRIYSGRLPGVHLPSATQRGRGEGWVRGGTSVPSALLRAFGAAPISDAGKLDSALGLVGHGAPGGRSR